jgi:hypothetical protein
LDVHEEVALENKPPMIRGDELPEGRPGRKWNLERNWAYVGSGSFDPPYEIEQDPNGAYVEDLDSVQEQVEAMRATGVADADVRADPQKREEAVARATLLMVDLLYSKVQAAGLAPSSGPEQR